jgi:hypothetical protein
MVHIEDLEPRQVLWAMPTTTSSSIERHCTPFTLPSYGVLTIDRTSVITLTHNAVFEPECTGGADWEQDPTYTDPTTVADLRDPFYASTLPQTYAIAAATVVSYMLVIMLFITPRTFFVGGPGGGGGFLGRRGIISGASGSTSVIGVGGRPWLQKVAALTVAISLTIATVSTFQVAERQYDIGYMDAGALRDEVVGGVELRIVRVISDTFLWLAQVQTLIRLFPRHKEKVIIKWTGFALIILDTVFSILNSFVANVNPNSARKVIAAVPALSYLFALALSILYAACVLYYSLSKRRFAFFHHKMRNIGLVALLALAAILIPVVFFILDVSKPNITGWGDYVRWVGAAAASVVVWEWVERIEALERDERKDGILGREIFDLDEMLEVTPSEEINWPGSRRPNRGDGSSGGGMTTGWSGATSQAHHIHNTRVLPHMPPHSMGRNFGDSVRQQRNVTPFIPRPAASMNAPLSPSRAFATTPISRDNTTSAASTEYTVHYHPGNQPTPALSLDMPRHSGSHNYVGLVGVQHLSSADNVRQAPQMSTNQSTDQTGGRKSCRQATKNPFKRQRASPPSEVAGAPVAASIPASSDSDSDPAPNLGAKVASLAPGRKGKRRIRASRRDTAAALPVTVIPAQPRRRAWQPAVQQPATSNALEPNLHLQGATEGTEHGDEEVRRTERSRRPTECDDLSVTQQRLDRYSPNNTNNQRLSQRGALVISEDRSIRGSSRPLQVVSSESAASQSSYLEGQRMPEAVDLPQAQMTTLDLHDSLPVAAEPRAASASPNPSTEQDDCPGHLPAAPQQREE